MLNMVLFRVDFLVFLEILGTFERFLTYLGKVEECRT